MLTLATILAVPALSVLILTARDARRAARKPSY